MSSPAPVAASAAETAPRLSLLQMVQSVAWSFFGVQSHAHRLRDFQRGQPLPFVLVGLLMTAAVVGLFALAAQAAIRFLGA